MRISDWSSDVCSSDLGRADAFASGRRGLPAETRAYVARIAPELGASGIASRAAAPPSAAPGWQRSTLFAERGANASVVEDSAPAVSDSNSLPERPTAAAPATGAGRPPHLAPLSGPDRRRWPRP